MVTQPGSPPKGRDIVAHPLQREDQVEIAGVAHGIIAAEDVAEIEIAERPDAVVERDDDDILGQREMRAVARRARPRSGAKTAAVEIDHHRALRRIGGRCPDVEYEAILGAGRAAPAELRAARTIGRCLDHFAMRLEGLRRQEARRAASRLAIGDALEDADAAVAGAAHLTRSGLDQVHRLAHRPRTARRGDRRQSRRAAEEAAAIEGKRQWQC